MKQFSKIIVTTFIIAFLASCSKDKDASPSSASVVGKWSFTSLGITTDIKTTEITTSEAAKIDDTVTEDLPAVFDIKADGTYSNGTETGIYTLDSGNKNIKLTPSSGDPYTFEIVSSSSSELVLGLEKSTKKDADGYFVFVNEEYELITAYLAYIIFEAKKINGEEELEKAKSVQLILKFKK